MFLRWFSVLMVIHITCCALILKPTVPKGMVVVPSGSFQNKQIAAFYMDKGPVTIQEYRKFVRKTGYITEAEVLGSGSIYNFRTEEWELKEGACWEYPLGKEYPKAQSNHPVTQVSWNDANAYCKWSNKRLPSVLEWEYAARSTQTDTLYYPWGNDLIVNGQYQANCWQGVFPSMNLVKDGFRFTSPIGYYGENALGLSDLAGNVWEWTTDEIKVEDRLEKVQKGGSFMCEKTVCHGYKITNNTNASPESSLFHVGFRTVLTIQ